MSDSTSLVHLGARLPKGGLAAFETEDNNVYSSGIEIYEKIKPTNKEQIFANFLLISNLKDQRIALNFLAAGVQQGLVTKDHLIALYKSQDPNIRSRRPLITLQSLWEISGQAFPREEKNSHPAPRIFTVEDLVLLANEFIEIYHRDVDFFFMQLFYRHEGALPFSKDFLTHWYNQSLRNMSGDYGKLSSLVCWGVYATFPELLNLDELIKRWHSVSESAPGDHGIPRFGNLCTKISEDKPEVRKKVIDAWATSFILMFKDVKSLFSNRFFLEIFFEYPYITEEEKEEVAEKINKKMREYAHELLSVVRNARRF